MEAMCRLEVVFVMFSGALLVEECLLEIYIKDGTFLVLSTKRLFL